LPFDIANFAVPYDKLFAHGTLALNLSHPITRQFIRAVAIAQKLGRKEAASKVLSESIRHLLGHGWKTAQVHAIVVYEQWIVELRNIWDALRAVSSIVNDAVPEFADFVPGTAVRTESELEHVRINLRKMPAQDDIKPFGQCINGSANTQ
jgi:hypothetical protein